TTVTCFLLDALNIVTGNYDREGGWVWGPNPMDFVGRMASSGMKGLGEHPSRVGGVTDNGGRQAWTLPQEIATPGRGQVRALFLCAGNPVMTTPDSARLEAGLDQLELVVALDLYVTESSRWADYILPAPMFLEREDVPLLGVGKMPRPWLQATAAVLDPPPGVREEWLV